MTDPTTRSTDPATRAGAQPYRAEATGRDGDRALRWPSQWFALIVGAVFVLVGLAGFAITGFDNFASHDTMEHLLIFEINPLHNIVHLAWACWPSRSAGAGAARSPTASSWPWPTRVPLSTGSSP